jgi:AraC family transcriptional regulator
MLALEKGTYLGKVLDLSQAGGIFAGATSYYPNDGTNLMHYHENPHLSFVLKGGGIVKSRRSEYERLPGEMMFFRAGEPHQCIAKRFPTRNVNLEIETAFLAENRITEADIGAAIRKNPHLKFNMLKVYNELLAADNFTDSSIKILLLDLVCAVRKIEKAEPEWLGTIRELMNDKWNEPLTLGDLSSAAGVHPVTVSKFFPRYFACTFGEYMRRLKVEKSLRLIKDSPGTLTEIAYECGFYDQSHFTRTFKKMTGFLPNSYAKL